MSHCEFCSNGRVSKKIYYLTDGVTVEKYEVYNYSVSKDGVTTYTTSTYDVGGKLISTSKLQILY